MAFRGNRANRQNEDNLDDMPDDDDDNDDEMTDELFAQVMRLSAELKKASKELGDHEARFLVSSYYRKQKDRIRSNNQISAINRAGRRDPHVVLDWYVKQNKMMEGQLKLALHAYARSRDMGQWLLSICGVGPVIAAGLLAHIDWTKPTVGHIWNFAGLNPNVKWLEGQTRPWNLDLKVVCWKAGMSFIKTQGKKKDFYGKFFAERKAYEVENNDRGLYANQAEEKQKQVGKDTDAWLWYAGCYPAGTTGEYMKLAERYEKKALTDERAKLLKARKGKPGSGQRMLPPGHLNARALRWVVKLFLSHAHFVGLWLKAKKLAPRPYPIEHMGHVHVIPPPNMDKIVGLQEAWDRSQRVEREAFEERKRVERGGLDQRRQDAL
jgi:hypothetical protein